MKEDGRQLVGTLLIRRLPSMTQKQAEGVADWLEQQAKYARDRIARKSLSSNHNPKYYAKMKDADA